jgi:putative FmdB family regulatory protein
MPLYDYECQKCGVKERFANVAEKVLPCECGRESRRILSSRYYVHGDIDFVTDNITGEPKRYSSRASLDKDLKAKGLYQKIGKGWM